MVNLKEIDPQKRHYLLKIMVAPLLAASSTTPTFIGWPEVIFIAILAAIGFGIFFYKRKVSSTLPEAASLKEKYLERIRSQSCYIVYRVFGSLVSVALAVLGLIAFFIGMAKKDVLIALLSLFVMGFALLLRVMIKMCADIADSVADLNHRYDNQ